MRTGTVVEERAGKVSERNSHAGEAKESSAHLIESLLLVLSSEERVVLALRYFEHLNFSQISDVLGIPLARVLSLHGSGVSFIRSRVSHSFNWASGPVKRA